jgi:hypothetical protein
MWWGGRSHASKANDLVPLNLRRGFDLSVHGTRPASAFWEEPIKSGLRTDMVPAWPSVNPAHRDKNAPENRNEKDGSAIAELRGIVRSPRSFLFSLLLPKASALQII